MTRHSFELISVGTDIHLIEEQYGSPYDISHCQGGIRQYRYIERLATAPGVTEHVHYIFLVSPEGRILQKRIENIGSPVQLKGIL